MNFCMCCRWVPGVPDDVPVAVRDEGQQLPVRGAHVPVPALPARDQRGAHAHPALPLPGLTAGRSLTGHRTGKY